jgi:hypothetical protein
MRQEGGRCEVPDFPMVICLSIQVCDVACYCHCNIQTSVSLQSTVWNMKLTGHVQPVQRVRVCVGPLCVTTIPLWGHINLGLLVEARCRNEHFYVIPKRVTGGFNSFNEKTLLVLCSFLKAFCKCNPYQPKCVLSGEYTFPSYYW